MKKIFKIAVILLILYGLYYIFTSKPKEQEIISPIPKSERVVTPTPTPDVRPAKVRNFFNQYNSPLAQDAKTFVQVADEVGIDYRILPAIAMVESSGGKFTPSCAPNNPFGWTSLTSPCGFYRFESFSQAIRYVGKAITTNRAYSDFRTTHETRELAKTYNISPDDWNNKLAFFMGKMD